MALIEVELVRERFNQLVRSMASAGPIPIGLLNSLGPNRLIAEFTWDDAFVGQAPAGVAPPFGTLAARCPVSLRHVSLAELDADPLAPGTTTAATAWIRLVPSATDLALDLLAIDVPGAATQWFTPPVPVRRQRVRMAGVANLAGAALLMRDDVVTLRFATRPTDSLQGTPLNLLPTTGNEWAIRLSGEFFTERLLQSLQGALATPPAGTSIEEAPSAAWGMRDGAWAAIGRVGLEKKNACPGLFGDVDLSITVDVVLTPSGNPTPPAPQPPRFNLTLWLGSDVSDWDAFRCWLGSGALASALLGYIASPIVGPGLGGLGFLAGSIVTLIAVAETVRLDAGKEITSVDIDDFTQVSSSSTTVTYTSQNNLPTLVTVAPNGSSNGATLAATTGPYGMLISGTILYLPATHAVTFTPTGGTLTSALRNSFDCGRKTWLKEAEIQPIAIEDRATIIGVDLGRVPVTIFNSSAAIPPHLWSVDHPAPAVDQVATVSGSELVKQGDGGRVYLHTSAGIRRFEIAPLPAAPPVTQEEIVEAFARCLRRSRIFTPREEIQWLIDPPPYDFGIRPVRQWLFTFAEVRAGTRIAVHRIADGVRAGRPVTFVAGRTGEAVLEFVTDASTGLLVEHDAEAIPEGRVAQRWLIPTQVLDTGEPGRALIRSGSLIAVIQPGGVFAHDVSTGASTRQRGRMRVAKPPAGGLEIVEERRRGLGAAAGITSRSEALEAVGEMPADAPPFSVTLPGGKVAAVMESRLVIGIPWESRRVIR